VATREPLDQDEPPLISLEALTLELVATLAFFGKVAAHLGRPGMFRIALGFSGFRDSRVDWSGFQEDPQTEATQGTLVNWRFQPAQEVAVYEALGVSFPIIAPAADFVSAIGGIVAEAAFAVKGERHAPISGPTESRLTLSHSNVKAVVTRILNDCGLVGSE